jgi:hypothetical protein
MTALLVIAVRDRTSELMVLELRKPGHQGPIAQMVGPERAITHLRALTVWAIGVRVRITEPMVLELRKQDRQEVITPVAGLVRAITHQAIARLCT